MTATRSPRRSPRPPASTSWPASDWCSPLLLAGLDQWWYVAPMLPTIRPRATAGVLLLTVLAVVAAGCGSNDDNNKSAPGTTASTGAAAGAKIALLLPENKTARY